MMILFEIIVDPAALEGKNPNFNTDIFLIEWTNPTDYYGYTIENVTPDDARG